MFTLKVIKDYNNGLIVSDDRHRLGGTDVMQVWAFTHLFPSGYCEFYNEDKLDLLAGLHGWGVEMQTIREEVEHA